MVDEARLERNRAHKPFLGEDYPLLRKAVVGVKTMLEFGPGDSTQLFLDAGVERIVSCEYVDKWYDVAVERFKDDPRVQILKFTDTFPVVVEGIGDEQFDIAFVDAPKGWPIINRHMHPGYEDCSRLNTCLYALERAPVVLMHDAYRPLERGTLGRLNRMGHKHTLYEPTALGLAKIIRGNDDSNTDGPNPPDAKKPGSTPARTKPKRRRLPVDQRPSGLDSSRAGEA